jgi:thioredoxin 1
MSTTTRLPVVDDDHFTAEILDADRPVLVDFTAAWCPPCRTMKPVLEEVAAARPDIKVVQVDVEDAMVSAARYEVLSMPTFVLFRGGVPVMRVVGARPRRRLDRELDEALGLGD